MLRYLVDESVHGGIVRALLRQQPNLELVRVQDMGLAATEDPVILEHAAKEGRVVLTSDVSTIVGYAYERVESGQGMPGVFVIGQGLSLGPIIEDILLLAGASIEGEWEAQVRYLPL